MKDAASLERMILEQDRRILFGGVSGRGWHRSYSGRRMAGRWERMTPEEREKFRHGMRGRCDFDMPASESKES